MNGAGVSVHGTLRDCRIRGNGHVGGSAHGAGFLNERTVWEGNSWKPISRDWVAGGVKITQEGPGEFRDCTFERNGGPGLWYDLDAHDIVVRRSRFVENEGSGVFIEISRDITIEGDIPDAARTRLMEIADRCPVHQTLTHEIKIRSRLVPGE